MLDGTRMGVSDSPIRTYSQKLADLMGIIQDERKRHREIARVLGEHQDTQHVATIHSYAATVLEIVLARHYQKGE